jgi:LysM repeat protein
VYNPGMQRLSLVVLLLLALALNACTSVTVPTNTPCAPPACTTPIFAGTLRLYLTDTPTASITPPLFKSPTPTPTATATPTPITYKVRDNDDMYGIAFRYGISPQALMTANPTVNPRAMGPGTVLIIPVTLTPANTGTPTAPGPSPTSIVSISRAPDCYPALDGGVWCFLLVKNERTVAIESITGTIRLAAGDGQSEQKSFEQAATTLLDILSAGESAPLVAYFPPPVPAILSPGGEVTLALPLPENDTRYLPATVQDKQVTIAPDGKSAGVTGHLALASGQASQVWIAATAFDASGAVVGVRKWEASSSLTPGNLLAFDFQVYTLGPLIDSVTLQVQARP